MQKRLSEPTVKYSYGPYNKVESNEQWVRLSEGCPHNCPWCYEPTEIKLFPIPEFTVDNIKIMDMNFLCKPQALSILRQLYHNRKVDQSFEFICGIDYRFLTQEIATQLRITNFKNIRLAWDGPKTDQVRIKKAISMLKTAKYPGRDTMVFMICNHESISYVDNCFKLDLCKVWGVKVADCYFDNQTSPNIIPLGWKDREIKDFRHRCRKHNQYVNFGIDPEL